MQKQTGLTLLDTIVLILIFLLILIIYMYTKPYKPARRVICAANLKGLAVATMVYGNDYDNKFPQLPGTGPWSKDLGFSYDFVTPDFSPGGPQANTPRTITASLYLLVREADVSPKSFICPKTDLNEFDGLNPGGFDIVELWDFGPDPYKHVSYSYHNPYGSFPADLTRSGDFAVMADMSPWFRDGNIIPPGQNNTHPQVIDFANESTWPLGNSINHKPKNAFNPEGQNISYADGHVSWETLPSFGLNNDNIYTFWQTADNPTEQDVRNGKNPTSRSKENDAQSEVDSFLAI